MATKSESEAIASADQIHSRFGVRCLQGQTQVVFIVTNTQAVKAVDIEELSEYPGEQEVLIMAGYQIHIVRAVGFNKQTIFKIKLKGNPTPKEVMEKLQKRF